MKQVPLFSTGIKEIDILTSIEGLSFRSASQRSMNSNFDLVPLKIIGVNDLLHTKRVAVSRTDDAQARDRDLKDIDLIVMHLRSL